MEPLNKNSRCPKCNEKLVGRRDALGMADTPVWGCSTCGLYGVEGDDRLFDREELGDAEMETKLKKRAAKLIENEKSLQRRFTDAPAGKVFG